MRAVILLIVILHPSLLPAEPDSRIEAIRSRYNQALEIEQGGLNYHHDIVLNTMLPAVGLQTTKIRFIYTSEQASPEKDPYLLTRKLHLVRVTYNVAASAQFHMEYLFDDRERPIFYFEQEKREDSIKEKRLYFGKGVLIRIIDSGRSPGAALISTEDHREARSIVRRAEEYLRFFRNLVRIEETH